MTGKIATILEMDGNQKYTSCPLRTCEIYVSAISAPSIIVSELLDFELKKVLLPPPKDFADKSYLEDIFKPRLLRDVCTLCSGA